MKRLPLSVSARICLPEADASIDTGCVSFFNCFSLSLSLSLAIRFLLAASFVFIRWWREKGNISIKGCRERRARGWSYRVLPSFLFFIGIENEELILHPRDQETGKIKQLPKSWCNRVQDFSFSFFFFCSLLPGFTGFPLFDPLDPSTNRFRFCYRHGRTIEKFFLVYFLVFIDVKIAFQRIT